MIHYQEAVKHEPHFRRMQPHGVRPGVCVDDYNAVYSLPGVKCAYQACGHNWVTIDDTGRYRLCQYCGLGWDNHKDQEAPVAKEHCCTCANSYKRNRKKGASLPEAEVIGILDICERCGQSMCYKHAPAHEDYPFMHCRSCQLEVTKENSDYYRKRKAELEQINAALRADLDTNPQPNVTALDATVLAKVMRAKAGRRSKAVRQ